MPLKVNLQSCPIGRFSVGVTEAKTETILPYLYATKLETLHLILFVIVIVLVIFCATKFVFTNK